MKAIARLILLSSALLLVSATQASAACGIGTTIWEGKSGTGAKLLAFTTNFWTLKGISTTFELGDCGPEDNIFKKASIDAELHYYASQNLDHLAVDMARGRGEYIDAFAQILEMPNEDVVALRILTQQNFEALFPHDYVTSNEMLRSLKELMAESEALSSYAES